MPYLPPPQSSITERSMSENKNSRNKSTYKVSKSKKNNRSAVRMKTKELSEENIGTHNFVNLKIGDTIDLNPSSALKRSRRLEGRQDSDKKSKDNDFLSHYKSPMATTSDQLLTKKGVSEVSDFTPPAFAKHKETCSKEKPEEQKNAGSGTHSHEKLKRMKNASPRRSGKKHIRKLDFSLPMEILNKHAFLLWFSERYQEFSRQYPNDSVKELQDRRRPHWEQLDYRKKAPYYQRARDASCIQYSPTVDSVTSKITEKTANNVAEVKVEPRPRGKPKSEPPTKSGLRESVQRHFNFKYEFDQMVKDLIWGRPVYFETDVQSEKLTQILKDLADLETSGKLICAVK